MIKKIIISLIGIIAAKLFIDLAAINLINLMIMKKIEFTLNFGLLDMEPKIKLISNIIILLIAMSILMGMFSKSDRKKLDNDKKNFTHLSSIHEAKRSLTRIQFHEVDGQWKLNHHTLLSKIDTILNPPKLAYDAILTFLRVDDWHKLNTIKKWTIDEKTVMQRAGLPIYMPRFRKKTMFVDANDNHSLLEYQSW